MNEITRYSSYGRRLLWPFHSREYWLAIRAKCHAIHVLPLSAVVVDLQNFAELPAPSKNANLMRPCR